MCVCVRACERVNMCLTIWVIVIIYKKPSMRMGSIYHRRVKI